MIMIYLLIGLLVVGVNSIACPAGQQPCGPNDCYDPNTQGCINGNTTIQCINSCNGTCYSSSQYCYNNTKVCNNNELVCNVTRWTMSYSYPYGLICYNSSQHLCSNNSLCTRYYSCGIHCLDNYYMGCANNQTLCPGYYYWQTNLNTCGSQRQCYDPTNSSCLNNTTVCPKSYTRLCGNSCWDPDAATCINGSIIRCINSCNGTCYSSSQYCYNNTKVCNRNELVCNVTRWSISYSSPYGLICYNSSQYLCSNNSLCTHYYSCGIHCLDNYYTGCANNQTLCPGYYYWNGNLNTCGSQRQCYDTTNSTCLSNTTVCPLGNQLCAGQCYNPQSQYCVGGNNTIYCRNNPSATNCLSSTTTATPPVSNTCCINRNCSVNSDCCQQGSVECQCYRHQQNDTFGFCANPNVTPLCGDSCPVQGRCRVDSDCCRCQCASVTFTDVNGSQISTRQCVRR